MILYMPFVIFGAGWYLPALALLRLIAWSDGQPPYFGAAIWFLGVCCGIMGFIMIAVFMTLALFVSWQTWTISFLVYLVWALINVVFAVSRPFGGDI